MRYVVGILLDQHLQEGSMFVMISYDLLKDPCCYRKDDLFVMIC